MKKTNILWFIIDLVFLVVFNVIFFMTGGFERTTTAWISYGTIHFAYLMLLLTPVFTTKGTRQALYGATVFTISITYFIVEFAVGLLFIVLKFLPYQLAIIVQLLLFGVYVVLLVSNILANEKTQESMKRHETEIIYTKDYASMLRPLIDQAQDRQMSRKIEFFYDLMHSSQAKSCEEVKDLEARIERGIEELKFSVYSDPNFNDYSLVDDLVRLATERERVLRFKNHTNY